MEILYKIVGTVKKGAGNGRKFGYPTANVSLQNHVPAGVYIAEVTIDGQKYKAATFIGSAVTFGDAEYKSESTILDFDQDIYDKEITINLVKKLRDNMNFTSEKELIKNIEKDVADTRKFFEERN